jgi:hypothetical protein
MAGYKISDIHKALNDGLGDDFNLELDDFNDKFRNDQTFRAASFEAMAVLDDNFDQKSQSILSYKLRVSWINLAGFSNLINGLLLTNQVEH